MNLLVGSPQIKMPESVLGVGVDLLEIDRVRRVHARWGEPFLRKIFQPQEVGYCFRQANPYPSLAARFAAKEAVAKALGTGIGADVPFQSILVTKNAGGAPEVLLFGNALRRLKCSGGSRVLISLSHSRAYAIAQAIIC